jgi:ornithine cyclodeaminase/alanine dehydrogenase-like protein (mu-crystallin family)
MRLQIQALSGYHDRVEVLLHANFQVLVDFIEKEKPHKLVDWKHTKEHSKAWKEMKELYTWYTKKRPNRKDTIWSEETGISIKNISTAYKVFDKSEKLNKQWEKEDQKNLHRLIDVRKYLWV